jgi:tetratricopeptide (TPR) repeat protein
LPLAQAFEGAQVLQALDLLDRAVALDPHFGPAMAAAAQCRMFVVAFGWSEHPEDHRRLGLELARRAVTVGADDAHTLALAANAISGLGRDMDNATALVDRAMILNPGSSRVWQQAGILLLIRGETELAIERIETAMRLDPLSPRRVVNRLFVGIALFHQRRFSEALAPLREAVEQVRSPLAIAYLAANHGQLGQAREARAALDLYWQRASMPIEGMSLVRREDQQNLFLEGLALAAGERPAGAP